MDCAREAIEYSEMRDMLAGLQALEQAEQDGVIAIYRCKNRWQRPTDGGWADVLINIAFVDGPAAGYICELQFVHGKMMVVRSQMGAHHEYGVFRAAAELRSYHAELEAGFC